MASKTEENESRTKKHVRGSSLLLVGRAVSIGINFAVQVIVVRYLAKADYGAFAYAMSMVVLGSTVALFGLGRALIRFVPIYQERGAYAKMAGTVVMVLATVLGLGVALALAVVGLQGVIAGNLVTNPLSVSLLLVLIALAPLQALDNVFEKMFAIFASPKALFFRRHLLGPGLKLCAVLPLVFLHSNIYVLAISYLVAGLLGTAISVVIILRVFKKKGLLRHFSPKTIRVPARSLFKFSVPLLATDVVFMLRTTLVTLMLEFFHGSIGWRHFERCCPWRD